jgi:hypothetical protein
MAELVNSLWNIWPATGKRRTSRKKVASALKRTLTGGISHALLVRAAKRYLDTPDAKRDGGQYVPGLHTWLSDERFDAFMDGIDASGSVSTLRWQAAVTDYHQRGHWDRIEFGPPPGEQGCRVPAELLAN